MKSIQDILGGRQMTGVIKTVQSGLPRFIPDSFFNVTNRVIGNKGTYMKVTGERRNAKTNNYGAPAREVSGQGLTETGFTLAHTFEEQNHNPLILQNLLGLNGDQPQALAIEEVDRQTKEFKMRFENLRTSAVNSIFANGKIYLGSDGAILYSSSGAVITVDFGVPATQQNQANGVITVPWSSSTADMIGNITTIKKTHVQNGKPPLMHAFYGSNITGYAALNANAKALIQQTPALANQYYNTGEIPDGFCGLKWHPIYTSYGLNSSDAVTEWFGGDSLILTPEPTTDWWRFYEGTFLIPTDIGAVSSDAMAAARSLSQETGMFGYAVVGHNPPTITQFAGDTFMPILADGASIWQLDVTP